MTLNSLRKNDTMKFITKTAFILSASLGLMTTSATAQQGNIKATGWFKTCNEIEGNKVCNVQFRVVTTEGSQVVTALNLIEVTGKVERKIFRILVPTGRSLPPGVQVQVDGKRAVTIPYAYCRPQLCAAEAILNDELVKIFKAGGTLEVTSLNFQSKANKVPITLKGFTAAFDGPPVKLEDLLKKQLADKLKQEQETEN